MSFTVTLTTIALMLAYAIPGFILIKCRKADTHSISTLATLLLYVCSPFQTVYAMQQIEYSAELLAPLFLSLGLGLLLMGGMLGGVYFIFRRKQQEVPYRLCTIATAMGNCGFMGIPLLEALLPDYPQAVAFAAMFFMAYNILMWTMVSFMITRDRHYISIKKIFLNPSVIAALIALAMFFARINLTGQVMDTVSILSKMCTPLCMFILGMRLALVPLKPIFNDRLQYLAVGLKLIAFPLLAMAVCSLLPLDANYVRFIYILCCVPCGTLVLTFAELLGEGQKTACNVVLLSTLLSIITMPVMLLFI